MSNEQAEKMAREYILKYKSSFAKGKVRVTKKEVNAAIRTIAREIRSLSASPRIAAR
jgi:hypothetical protein